MEISPHSLSRNTAAVMAGARLLLRKPTDWCRGADARDEDGQPTPFGNPKAVSFSLRGAYRLSQLVLTKGDLPALADRILSKTTQDCLEDASHLLDLDVLSDNHTATFDQAITVLDMAFSLASLTPLHVREGLDAGRQVLIKLKAVIEDTADFAGDPKPAPGTLSGQLTLEGCLRRALAETKPDLMTGYLAPYADLAARHALANPERDCLEPYEPGQYRKLDKAAALFRVDAALRHIDIQASRL